MDEDGFVQVLQGQEGSRRGVVESAPAEHRTRGTYTLTTTARSLRFEAREGHTPVQAFRRLRQPDVVWPAEWEPSEEVLWAAPRGAKSSWGVADVYQAAIPVTSTRHVIFVNTREDRDNLHVDLAESLGDRDFARVTYVPRPLDGVWIRDYGPIALATLADGEPIVGDMRYLPGLPRDDSLPQDYARLRGWRYRGVEGLRLEGGNLMSDGHGRLFLTGRAIEGTSYEANDDSGQVEEALFALGGREVLWFERMPREREKTGHIDMFAKLTDASSVLVGRTRGPAGPVLDRNAARFAKLGYVVTRVEMGDSPSLRGIEAEWLQTYTNALFIGDLALVPNYGDPPRDRAALEAYRQAGYRAVGIDVRATIKGRGAIHCISMQIPRARGAAGVPPPAPAPVWAAGS